MPFQYSNGLAHDPLEQVRCIEGKTDLEGSPFFQNLVSIEKYVWLFKSIKFSYTLTRIVLEKHPESSTVVSETRS